MNPVETVGEQSKIRALFGFPENFMAEVDNIPNGAYVIKQSFQTSVLIMGEKQTTKDRLLEAACTIFADKGFRDATVAEICEAANANIAAVNYYFGDKEKLYDEVWHCAFSHATEAYPVDGGLPKDSRWLR